MSILAGKLIKIIKIWNTCRRVQKPWNRKQTTLKELGGRKGVGRNGGVGKNEEACLL